MLRQIALTFLRSTSKGSLQEALPDEKPDRATQVLRALRVPQLFRAVGRFVGRFLSARQKAWIQDSLINRARIPVNLQRDDHGLRSVLRRGIRDMHERKGPHGFGDYLEFGVYQGNSLIHVHDILREEGLGHIRLFGFDSFQGLPETAEQEGVWSNGQYRVDLEFTRDRLQEKGVDLERTVLVPGFFSDTLSAELVEEHGIEAASLIMIDCDLYSSTREALDFCEPLIRDEAVVLFDDWHSTSEDQGEQKALAEFLDRNPHFEAEPYEAYSKNSKAFLLRRLACLLPAAAEALEWAGIIDLVPVI
ncbi:MAG: TylF/MycF/NovP-related O-methyltransferase [Thermoanaerobaculia bacterium]